jgi:Secretion system C-terminal sorting domain
LKNENSALNYSLKNFETKKTFKSDGVKMRRKTTSCYLTIIIIILFSIPLMAANTWIPLNTPDGIEYAYFTNIDNVGEDLLWASCGYSLYSAKKLIKSDDGGKSWTDLHTFSNNIKDLEFIDANKGFIITEGKMYKTHDSGSNWIEINTGLIPGELEVISENIIWATSGKYIIKTTDGGSHWQTDTITTMNRSIIDLSAINSDRAWVILEDPYSTNNTLYSTTDGGNNWSSKVYTGLVDVEMAAIDTGYVCYGERIYKTTDNGSIWNQVQPMSDDYYLYALDSKNVWAYSNTSGPIYRTVDGGETWEYTRNKYGGSSISGVYDLCAYDTSLAWYGDSYRIYKHVPYPELELLYPNAGDEVNAGETTKITWRSKTIEHINIYYTVNGTDWLLIADSVETASGEYYWQTPAFSAAQCKIKLEPSDELFVSRTTESDGYFSIVIPPIAFKDFDLYEECEFSENNPLNVLARDIPIRLKIKIRNNLTQNLLSASGILSTSNPYISLSNNTSSYNNILVNNEEWSSNEFEFSISNNAPNEFTSDFTLEVNDQIVTGGPWTCEFSLPIVLDPFEVGLVLIDDDSNPDSQGDNDDIVEPGEHVEIIPLLNNVSNNEYDKVEGELFALSDEIDIWDFRSGASGVVYSHYPYNVVSGTQEMVTALQTNIMPEQDFVFTCNFTGTYSFPLLIQISADVPKYDDMEMRWAKEFIINSSYPVSIKAGIPEYYTLSHYPNPFNPNAIISYQLPFDGRVNLSIYDMNGYRVRTLINGFQNAGSYNMNFNASDLPSGVYIYRLSAGNKVLTKKMVLMK